MSKIYLENYMIFSLLKVNEYKNIGLNILKNLMTFLKKNSLNLVNNPYKNFLKP